MENTNCQDCGMTVETGEYHPFAACIMFVGCHNSSTVRENLKAVQLRSYNQGCRDQELKTNLTK